MIGRRNALLVFEEAVLGISHQQALRSKCHKFDHAKSAVLKWFKAKRVLHLFGSERPCAVLKHDRS